MLFRMMNKKLSYMCIFSFLACLILDNSIWSVYLSSKNISSAFIGVLEMILQCTVILFEIPTGIISDIFSRKISLMLSKVLIILYCIGMICFNSESLLIITFIVLAVSETLATGSDESIIYDIADSNDKTYLLKINTYFSACIDLSTLVSIILGAIFSKISWSYVYIFTIISQIMSILVLSKVEVEEKKKVFNFKDYIIENKRICIKSKYIFNNSKFLLLILGIVVFTAYINILYIFTPLILNKYKLDTIKISIVTGIISVFSILVMMNIEKLLDKYGMKKIIFLPGLINICLTLICIFSLRIKVLLIIAIIFINIVGNLFYPIATTLINDFIESDVRATMNSLINLIHSLIMCVLSPLMGYILDKNIIVVIFTIGIIVCIVSVLLIYKYTCENKL